MSCFQMHFAQVDSDFFGVPELLPTLFMVKKPYFQDSVMYFHLSTTDCSFN